MNEMNEIVARAIGASREQFAAKKEAVIDLLLQLHPELRVPLLRAVEAEFAFLNAATEEALRDYRREKEIGKARLNSLPLKSE